jgi:hypothetical protein
MVFILGALVGCASMPAEEGVPAPPAFDYLVRLRSGVDRARLQMAAIVASAEEAAARYAKGGRLFAAGSQEEFAREMIDRNGGLAEIGYPPARMDRLRRGDIILFGARSQLTANDRLKISRWREAGVYVVTFAARNQHDPFFRPEVIIDSGDEPGVLLADGKLIPTDGTINIINAWTWTGEFIGACTRLNKPPPIAGPVRVAYRDSKTRIERGVLGKNYLAAADRAIQLLQEDAIEDGLPLAGQWLRDAGTNGSRLLVVGQLFPEHFSDARTVQLFGDVRQFEKGKIKLAAMTLTLGGQSAPQLSIDAAHLRRTRLVYSSAERARDDRGEYMMYVNPHCPAEDGCVSVEGYKVPALPIGTVMQSAVYWAVVAEAVAPVGESGPRLPPSAITQAMFSGGAGR